MVKKKENFAVISTGAWVPSHIKDHISEERTYKIFINNLELNALIGIHDYEKKKKQKILISVLLEAFDNNSKISDKIENVVSYEFIVSDIKKLVMKGHTGLLETLAEKIAEICLRDMRVISAKINIEKIEVFKEAKGVGIEIYRKKEIDKLENKQGPKLK